MQGVARLCRTRSGKAKWKEAWLRKVRHGDAAYLHKKGEAWLCSLEERGVACSRSVGRGNVKGEKNRVRSR